MGVRAQAASQGGVGFATNTSFTGNGIGQMAITGDGCTACGVAGRNVGIWSAGSNVGFFYKNNSGDGILDVGAENGSGSSPAIYLTRRSGDYAKWNAQAGNVVFGGVVANQKLSFIVEGNTVVQIDTAANNNAVLGGYDGVTTKDLRLRGGVAATTNQPGGSVRLEGSTAGATNQNGGSIILTPSAASGAGANGTIQFITTGVVQVGGTTSSFPGLKPSSTTLQARLADDSAFAPLQGKLTTDTNATTGLVAGALAALTTASITVYDSSGQAYRVPCVI